MIVGGVDYTTAMYAQWDAWTGMRALRNHVPPHWCGDAYWHGADWTRAIQNNELYHWLDLHPRPRLRLV